jgi:hypothetical protein
MRREFAAGAMAVGAGIAVLAFGPPALGAQAPSTPEPLGQETVETRPLRNPQARPRRGHARPARGHAGHTHTRDRAHRQDARHAHDGGGGRVHAHRSGAGHPHAGRRNGADGDDDRHANGHDNGIETENLFGFTLGSDIEEKGTKEAAVETVGRFGKRDGTYAGVGKKLEFGFSVTDDFNVAFGPLADYHRVLGVTGLDDVKGLNFNGFGSELRWRLAKRTKDAVGVTLHFEPSVQRVDELTGLRGVRLGSENKLIFDRELIPDRLFAAFNLIYELERMRENGSAEWEDGSKVGVAAAASVQIAPKFFLGSEVRYLRAYEGLLPNTFLGDAVYVGPTMFWRFAPKAWISAAWNVQVGGHEVGHPLRLDLTNFERQQTRVKVGVEF